MARVRRSDGKGYLVDADSNYLDSSLFENDPVDTDLSKCRIRTPDYPTIEMLMRDLDGESAVESAVPLSGSRLSAALRPGRRARVLRARAHA